MIVEHGTLVVAADGGGAVIYRNSGNDGLARLEVVETHNASHHKAPGGGKTALAGHDYHEQGERQFASTLAARVDELIGAHQHAKTQPSVVMIASPRFLGVIRGDYSARLKAALKAEISKDLRESPIKQIEHALAALAHS